MFLVQDIRAHQEPIWAAKFSPCGNYLATGGKDGVLKIWSIIIHKSKHYDMANTKIQIEEEKEPATSKEQLQDEKNENLSKFYHLVDTQPLRQYWEHEFDIVDLSWQTKKDSRGKIEKS
jgi:WD40 repeat protein